MEAVIISTDCRQEVAISVTCRERGLSFILQRNSSANVENGFWTAVDRPKYSLHESKHPDKKILIVRNLLPNRWYKIIFYIREAQQYAAKIEFYSGKHNLLSNKFVYISPLKL